MVTLLLLGMGSYALSGQVVLLRELLVILAGHELCLGILFASWLGGIFLGARVGGATQKWFGNPLKTFVGAQAAAVLLGPVLVLLIRHLRTCIPGIPGVPLPLLPTILSAIALITPLSFLIGFLFPVACRMVRSSKRSPVRDIGRVYVLEAMGSLLAGVLLTYLLLPHLDSMAILAWGGFGVLVLCTATTAMAGSSWAALLGCLSFFSLLTLLSGGVDFLHHWSIQARWDAQHPGIRHVATVNTKYQSLELGRLNGQYTLFGNGHILSTFPDRYGAARTVHLTMNQRTSPKDILLIGGGPGSIIPLMLEYPIKTIHAVQLDAKVLELARPYLGPEGKAALKDARVKWSFQDGRYVVKKLPPHCVDAVILHVPDPSTALLNRYHTLEFFRQLDRILRPEGFLATSLTASVNYVGAEMGGYVGSVYSTLKTAFPNVLLIPGDRVLFLAAKTSNVVSADPSVLAQRFRQQRPVSESIRAEIFKSWIQRPQIGMWEEALNKYEGPLNRDVHPVAYFHYLGIWNLMAAGKFTLSPLRHLMDIPYEWVVFLGLSFLVLAFSFRGPPKRFMLPLLAIGITGFVAMAQEILCIYMYQSLQGYLYSRLGLIVALFMTGLALGGWVAARYLSITSTRSLSLLLVDQAFILMLCLGVSLAWIPVFFGTQNLTPAEGLLDLLVGLWMVLIGFGTGAAFPLVCRLRESVDSTVGAVAGKVDAYDHLGAALGAILPGVFLIPVFGLTHTSILLAILQGGAVVLLCINFLDLKRQTD